MVAKFNHKIKQKVSIPSPATKPSWRFGDLSAAELLPQLQQYLHAQDAKANWQLVWLNNDGRAVIGLLPKVSWSIHPSTNDSLKPAQQADSYEVITNCRDANHNDKNPVTTKQISYIEWQNELIAYSQAHDSDSGSHSDGSNSATKVDEQPNYHHGLMGFIGYDIAAHELSTAANIKLATQPCAVLGHYDIYLTANAKQTHWQLNLKTDITDIDNAQANQHNSRLIKALIGYLDGLESKLSAQKSHKPYQKQPCPVTQLLLKARWSKASYQQAFQQTQNYLQQGDCYQINLTQAWQGSFNHSFNDNTTSPKLIDYLPALHANTQAPFAGYLTVNNFNSKIDANAPKEQFELLSCSPELFFTFIKDDNTCKHLIRTKPIKGTMPRGTTIEQDNFYKQQLIDSEKDRAENVMIVDLLRNDLGKYAKIGSVKVPQLFAIESFSNVHHMVSTITAELRVDTHPLAVLFGSLPAGSITGTPKKRAVEIIAELEATPRGAYCGTMGYMNFDGSGQWNVLIRTLQAHHVSNDRANNISQFSLWAGGGITIASDCDAEYQECLDKVGNLLSVLAKER